MRVGRCDRHECRCRADAGHRLRDAREMAFDAGIVISASHNPFQDNGIKVFSGHGQKFTESLEREVEAIVAADGWTVPASAQARVAKLDVADAYLAHARLALPDPQRLGRFKIVVDTANGATTTVAPQAVLRAWVRRAPARGQSRRPEHQPRLRLDASAGARTGGPGLRRAEWALPSTATGTARFSPTRPAPWSMAMPCCSSAAGR